jgi:hypothetical protein
LPRRTSHNANRTLPRHAAPGPHHTQARADRRHLGSHLVGSDTSYSGLVFFQLSLVGVVYGSLATTIVGLLSLEIASILLLLGAQIIGEYERLQDGDNNRES